MPRRRGGRHARHDRRVGAQRPQTRAHRRAPPRATGRGERPAPAPGSPAERALVDRLTRAYRSGDVDALVALLTDDVLLAMPPIPLEYVGRGPVAGFFTEVFRLRTYDVVPTRANGQPAVGTYLRAPAGEVRHGTGVDVLTLDGDRIRAITHFDRGVLPSFGLPRSLPPR
ncbi:nuclear transport factor 2 family protein [Pseudonocardia sichuanensis]